MTVRQYLDLSTAHMTEDDSKLLDHVLDAGYEQLHALFHGGYPTIVTAHGYGWWVHVTHTADELAVLHSTWTAAGFSRAFCDVVIKAHTLNCDWINFDQAARTRTDLPVFSW